MDFLAYFILGHHSFWEKEALEPQHLHTPLLLMEKCVPFLYYCTTNYHINSTKLKSSIAIAAVCYVL